MFLWKILIVFSVPSLKPFLSNAVYFCFLFAKKDFNVAGFKLNILQGNLLSLNCLNSNFEISHFD